MFYFINGNNKTLQAIESNTNLLFFSQGWCMGEQGLLGVTQSHTADETGVTYTMATRGKFTGGKFT